MSAEDKIRNGENIILIGMMGSGKSAVGKELGCELEHRGYKFVDLDEHIEKHHGKIADIFATRGEDDFRFLESNALQVFTDKTRIIISTGGGVLKNEENISILRQLGTIFYLQAPANVLYERIKGDIGRPLLKSFNEFEKTLEEREENYKLADHIVDAQRSPRDVAQEVLRRWN